MTIELVTEKKVIEKTLFLFCENNYTKPFFIELHGNYSHLNDVFINDYGCKKILRDELDMLLYDSRGNIKNEITKLYEPTFDWKYFCNCGKF